MGKPSVILTAQFTTPKAKSFDSYVSYMTRKEALLEKKNRSQTQERELELINKSIESYNIEYGELEDDDSTNTEKKDKKELEALEIIKYQNVMRNSPDYEKYINYMSRQYALETKVTKNTSEELELNFIQKKIKTMIPDKKKESNEETPEIKQGVFSADKSEMTIEDIREVHKIINNAQKNGSVFYQDVISFDTDFLVKEKIYNPKKDELDEKKLQRASCKMMEKMFDSEEINSGYWFASIHRNTDNIHIHFGTVETKNTRKVITVEEDGELVKAPKGKRKQKTLDEMKSAFANALIDRTAELSRISDLRNTLVEDIKKEYKHDNKKERKLMKDVYKELPSNKKYWQYGSKHVSDTTREKIDDLTTILMQKNKNYKEYVSKVDEEGEYRKELFGDSKRSEKNYASNQKEDIKKRLGNSLLKEMRRSSETIESKRRAFGEQKGFSEKKFQHSPKNQPIIHRKSLNQVKRVLDDDLQKYRAEREHEMMERKIAMESKSREM